MTSTYRGDKALPTQRPQRPRVAGYNKQLTKPARANESLITAALEWRCTPASVRPNLRRAQGFPGRGRISDHLPFASSNSERKAEMLLPWRRKRAMQVRRPERATVRY